MDLIRLGMDSISAAGFSTWNVKNKQFPFYVSAGWVQDFKKKHKMRQRQVTKYNSSMDNETFKETVIAPELFEKQTPE
jgi:hypothetical protein